MSSSPNSERIVANSATNRASSTGRRQWTKPSLVSAVEADLAKANQQIECLQAELMSVKDELQHEKDEKKSLLMSYGDTKARLNNEILSLRKSLSLENVDYISEIDKHHQVRTSLEEELVNAHILTDTLRSEVDALKQRLVEAENEIVMIESHWQEQMNRVTQQFEQGMLLLKEKMKAKYAKQSTEAIQKQKHAFNQQHNNNINNSSASSTSSSVSISTHPSGMMVSQGRHSAGQPPSSSIITMPSSAAIPMLGSSDGPEVISPASTPPSSPRKHRPTTPNVRAVALSIPRADHTHTNDHNHASKQVIISPMTRQLSSSSNSTPRNSISGKSNASSLNSTPQPSVVHNAMRKEGHKAVTTPSTTISNIITASSSSSSGLSYDPYNYSVEMKIDAQRSHNNISNNRRISGKPPDDNNIVNNISNNNNNQSETTTSSGLKETAEPTLDPKELNGFIRYFMNNSGNGSLNNSGGGGGASQANSVVTSQTTAPTSYSSSSRIISPTTQDLNHWRVMTSSNHNNNTNRGHGINGSSNDFFVKVARSELISPLRSVLRRELKGTFMHTSSSSTSMPTTPTAVLNTISSPKQVRRMSPVNFSAHHQDYTTTSASPRFMNNTSSTMSKINNDTTKDGVIMPNSYLGKQRSGGVWRLSW